MLRFLLRWREYFWFGGLRWAINLINQIWYIAYKLSWLETTHLAWEDAPVPPSYWEPSQVTPPNLGNRSCTIFLGRLWLPPGTDLCCLGLCVSMHSWRKWVTLYPRIHGACIGTLPHLSWSPPVTKHAVMAGHCLGQQPGGTKRLNLQTRKVDVDRTWVAHGLSTGAGRASEQKFFQRSTMKLCCANYNPTQFPRFLRVDYVMMW